MIIFVLIFAVYTSAGISISPGVASRHISVRVSTQRVRGCELEVKLVISRELPPKPEDVLYRLHPGKRKYSEHYHQQDYEKQFPVKMLWRPKLLRLEIQQMVNEQSRSGKQGSRLVLQNTFIPMWVQRSSVQYLLRCKYERWGGARLCYCFFFRDAKEKSTNP